MTLESRKFKRSVGMICNIKKDQHDKIIESSWTYRAFIMNEILHKKNIQLIIYSPYSIQDSKASVNAYIIEKNKFKMINTLIPKYNYDFWFGMPTKESSQGMSLRLFRKYAQSSAIFIYPGIALSIHASDKWRTHQFIERHSPNISIPTKPYTSKEGLYNFLHQHQRIFMKPRHGSLGKNIIVINIQKKPFEVYFQQHKKNRRFYFFNEEDLLSHCIHLIDQKDYIMQKAINVLRINDRVFDIRVIALNDGKKQIILYEGRLGAPNNEVSNVSQGGEKFMIYDKLSEIISIEKIEQLLNKIKTITLEQMHSLHNYLSEELNEVAFDFILDQQLQPYIAEINTKPIIAGTPELIHNIYKASLEERMKHKLTFTHAKYLANFLIHKSVMTVRRQGIV